MKVQAEYLNKSVSENSCPASRPTAGEYQDAFSQKSANNRLLCFFIFLILICFGQSNAQASPDLPEISFDITESSELTVIKTRVSRVQNTADTYQYQQTIKKHSASGSLSTTQKGNIDLCCETEKIINISRIKMGKDEQYALHFQLFQDGALLTERNININGNDVHPANTH